MHPSYLYINIYSTYSCILKKVVIEYFIFNLVKNMNRLKDLREDKDLTQKELSKMLVLGQAGYSKYENEKNNILTIY